MDRQELSITADLAQIELDEREFHELGKEVERMIQYFHKMAELDCSRLKPTTHVLLERNRLRPDTYHQSDSDALVESAPDSEDRFIVIPNVL